MYGWIMEHSWSRALYVHQERSKEASFATSRLEKKANSVDSLYTYKTKTFADCAIAFTSIRNKKNIGNGKKVEFSPVASFRTTRLHKPDCWKDTFSNLNRTKVERVSSKTHENDYTLSIDKILRMIIKINDTIEKQSQLVDKVSPFNSEILIDDLDDFFVFR
jgi:hypothetical protein